MAREESEKGVEWWVRYVLVPVIGAVLGGGGLIALIISVREHPKEPPPPVVAESKETIDFYLSTKVRARDNQEAVISIGEQVLVHWNITNSHGETFFLTQMALDGRIISSKKIPPYGVFADDDPLDTVDFILEKDDGTTNGKTMLKTLRVTTSRH
jgi:hypothetical protein